MSQMMEMLICCLNFLFRYSVVNSTGDMDDLHFLHEKVFLPHDDDAHDNFTSS